MLTNEREKAICKRYGAKDEHGKVHCNECPLKRYSDATEAMCKSIGHYDRHKRKWVLDFEEEICKHFISV